MQGTELHIWMREPYVIFTFGGDLLSTHAVWQTRKCDIQVDTQWIEFQWLPCGMKLFSSFTLVGSYNIFQQVGKGDLSVLVFKFWSQRSPTWVGRWQPSSTFYLQFQSSRNENLPFHSVDKVQNKKLLLVPCIFQWKMSHCNALWELSGALNV